MEFQLSRFSIKNLHGDTSVEITMDDKIRIKKIVH